MSSFVPDEILRKIITQQIQKIIETEKFENCKYEVTSMPCTARNYTGALYSIDVVDKEKGTLNLFAKIANIPEDLRQQMPVVLMYNRERFMYKDIVCVYEALQDKHEIPEEHTYKFPKYYSSNETAMEEVLILENLTSKGYVVGDRNTAITLEYAKKGIGELAKFHALSFTLEIENPAFFDEHIIGKYEFVNARLKDEEAEKYRNRLFSSFYVILNEENRDRLQAFVQKVTRQMWVDQYKVQRRPVLVHGDFRQSNLMTLYKDGKIESMIPVDYQTVYYGSPVNDLLYFIFTGTDEELRKQHYEELIEFYYKSLTDQLVLFSLDIGKIYPKEEFELDVKERTLYGLVLALFVLPYTLAMEKPDFNVSVEELEIKQGPAFKDRFNGIVNDFVKWGYI